MLQDRTLSCALIDLGLSLAGSCYVLWCRTQTDKLDLFEGAKIQSRHDVDSQKLMLAFEHGAL